MLAAGGTGGHLFPAFALAEELQRRGVAVDLMTDMRGDRYGSGFPARNVYRCLRQRLQDARPSMPPKRHWHWRSGTNAAHIILKQVRPAVVVGFGGYPTFPPLDGGAVARHSNRPARAECRAWACQQDARQTRNRHRDIIRAH